jgi:hypothetical protein
MLVFITLKRQNWALKHKKWVDDMDEKVNQVIRKHELAVRDWELSDLAKEMYLWFDRFNCEYFNDLLGTAVISFEATNKRVLGHYVLHRNAVGLKWNININRLYIILPQIHLLSILLHEQIHLWQQEFGRKPVKKAPRNNCHNVEYRNRAESIGIPCSQYGESLHYTNPFVSFVKSFGVDESKPLFTPPSSDVEKKARGSTLQKWQCHCTNVRVGIRDFREKCLKCGELFVRC